MRLVPIPKSPFSHVARRLSNRVCFRKYRRSHGFREAAQSLVSSFPAVQGFRAEANVCLGYSILGAFVSVFVSLFLAIWLSLHHYSWLLLSIFIRCQDWKSMRKSCQNNTFLACDTFWSRDRRGFKLQNLPNALTGHGSSSQSQRLVMPKATVAQFLLDLEGLPNAVS